MTTDLKMLAWIAGLTALMWIPYMLAHIANVGFVPALNYTGDGTPLPPWAARAKKAHYNAIENLAPFAALVLAAHFTNANNESIALAAIIYFWARIAHYVLYTAGVPLGRTLSFAVAWAATMWVFWMTIVWGMTS